MKKIFKYVICLYFITLVLRVSGVDAATYLVLEVREKYVPILGVYIYNTPVQYIPDAKMGNHHYVKNYNFDKGKVNVRVAKIASTGNVYGEYYPLTSGSTINVYLTHPLSPLNLYMQGGNFRLEFKSSWDTFSEPLISTLDWYLKQ